MANLKSTDSELTIVILSYNVKDVLTDCLNSLLKFKSSKDKWRILVVDNSSSDGTQTHIENMFPGVEFIQNGKNLGFAAGNNVALRKVSSPYCLLLNPDTVVYANSIQFCLDFLKKHSKVGAVTCRVELPDGSLDYSCHRNFPNPWNSFLHFFTGGFKRFSSYSHSAIPEVPHEIDSLTGAFALIRTSLGKQLKWFDEDYYWNGEDLDLCYRIKKLGWKIYYLPQVKITHFKGSSSGLWKTGKYKINKSNKIRSAKAGVGAMRIFYDKHLASSYPFIFNQFVYLGMWVLKKIRILKIVLS